MTYDPISEVEDEVLQIDDAVVVDLVAFRNNPKPDDLPGEDTEAERERLSSVLDALIDKLIAGIKANSKALYALLRRFRDIGSVVTVPWWGPGAERESMGELNGA